MFSLIIKTISRFCSAVYHGIKNFFCPPQNKVTEELNDLLQQSTPPALQEQGTAPDSNTNEIHFMIPAKKSNRIAPFSPAAGPGIKSEFSGTPVFDRIATMHNYYMEQSRPMNLQSAKNAVLLQFINPVSSIPNDLIPYTTLEDQYNAPLVALAKNSIVIAKIQNILDALEGNAYICMVLDGANATLAAVGLSDHVMWRKLERAIINGLKSGEVVRLNLLIKKDKLQQWLLQDSQSQKLGTLQDLLADPDVILQQQETDEEVYAEEDFLVNGAVKITLFVVNGSLDLADGILAQMINLTYKVEKFELALRGTPAPRANNVNRA